MKNGSNAMKKIKTGTVEIDDSNFDDANALIRVTMMLPIGLVRDLKRLSLTEEHGGKYQVLIRDILHDWVAHQGAKRKRA
jgi:hypothetical protein